MSAISLSLTDAAFVATESRAAPNHVGGLLVFRLPNDAPQEFMRRLKHDFRNERHIKAPWNRRLCQELAATLWPTWEVDREIELEYHVRHATLPWPASERELGDLVGRLQSTPIDLARPPSEPDASR